MKINSLTIDLETTGLDPLTDEIILIGYRYNGENNVRFIEFANGERGDQDFRDALANPEVVKRGHNVKFDVRFLLRAGYVVLGPLDCTRILCYLEDPFRSTSLKDLVVSKLGKKTVTRLADVLNKTKLDKKLKKNRKVPLKEVSMDDWKPYNAADVINCDELKKNVSTTEWYKKVEQPLISGILSTEERGAQLDIEALKAYQFELETEIKVIEGLFGTVNLKSPAQVKTFLEQYFGKMDATDKLSLKKLLWKTDPKTPAYSYVENILRYREISKLLTTYVVPLIEKADSLGRIHGSFNQAGSEKGTDGTNTGRLTSSDPNLQNIPSRTKEGKNIRKAFVPTTGYWMFDTDLSQIEPRLIAHYSQAPKLIKAYANNIDTHGMFASDIYGKPIAGLSKLERFIGKTSWLASVYGCYYKKLLTIAQTLTDEPLPPELDEEYFKGVQDKFWLANPEIASWRRGEIALARQCGYIVTIGGRIIRIPNLYSKSKFERMEAERHVINYKIQGSASDIMKIILVNFYKEYQGTDRHVLATIHDEVLGEVSDKYNLVQEFDTVERIMTQSVKLNNVSIGAETKWVNNWSEK